MLSRLAPSHSKDPRVYWMQGLIFILISTLLIIKPTANGLFLSLYGVEALPIAYVLTAFIAVIVSVLYSYFISRYSVYKLLRSSMYASIVFLSAIGVLLIFNIVPHITLYSLYLFVAIFGILTASQFWLMANQVFNTREAKKYFGWIGSGAIAGGIAGGYLASIFSDWLGSDRLLFVAAGVLLIGLYILHRMSTYVPKQETEEQATQFEPFKLFTIPLKLVFESKHLTYLAILIALSVFTAKMIDYQFGYFATQAFPDEDELTSFFGFWYSSFNIISLLIQLFVTQRVVGKLGVGLSLYILPGLLFINVGILIGLPMLMIVLSMKLFDGSLKQSINKAAVELLSIPIPDSIKLKTKTFLDVFVDSLATGLSGIFLLIIINTLELPNKAVSAIMMVSITLWIYFVYKIRQEYKKTFRLSLKLKSDQIEATNSLNILNQFIEILNQGDEYQILKILKKYNNLPSVDIEKATVGLLNHDNSKIKTAAINFLTFRTADHSDVILPLIAHEDQNIKVAAFEYLLNHDQKLSPNYFFERINDPDIKVQSAALVAVAKEYANQHGVEKMLRLSDRVSTLRDEIENKSPTESRILIIALLKIIGYAQLKAYYPFIREQLSNPDLKIQRQAILAIGHTESKRLLNIVCFNTDVGDENWDALSTTLSKFDIDKIHTVLHKAIESGKTDLIRSVISALQEIPNIDSVNILLLLTDHKSSSIKNKAIEALSHLADNYPLLPIDTNTVNALILSETRDYERLITHLRNVNLQDISNIHQLSIDDISAAHQKLVLLLEEKINQGLKKIFHLLHIKYTPEDLKEIYTYVLSEDKNLRNNALDFLENILNNELKSILVPLIEFNIVYPDFAPAKKDAQISIYDVIADLKNSEDLAIRKATLTLINLLKV